jgi:hypothetical protein
MKVEYIKYPKESDADFSYRIRRSSKDLNMRILTLRVIGELSGNVRVPA